MPNHSTWVHANEPIRIMEEGTAGFRLQVGAGSDHDVVRITRSHAESMLAQFHRLFGLSPAVVDAGNSLDAAWRAIDALGGWFPRANPEAAAYDRGLSDAIKAIEALGGMDPAQRAALSAQPSEHLVAA